MIVGKTHPKKQDSATIWVDYQGKAKGKTYPKWPITLLEQYIIGYIISSQILIIEPTQINQRRLDIINKRSQTKLKKGFNLILDDQGHRKSGNFTSVVGRQYIGEIGKTDKVIVTVTTDYYDGKKVSQQKLNYINIQVLWQKEKMTNYLIKNQIQEQS